jgi:Zn-dependent M28 family amino/carboxypeptidase
MRSARATVATLAATVICAVGLVAIPPAAEAGRGGGDHHHGHGKCERNNNSVRKLLECVKLKGVLQHERALQRIADRNDGNRASGTSGYDKSLKYVEWRMKKAGYKVSRQEFEFNKFTDLGGSVLEQTDPNDVTYVEGTDFEATTQSEPGDVTAPVTVVDIQLGPGNTTTSGCEPEDFTGFPAGNIALIQRGACTFELKAENAATAGASGVLFFNQGNDPNDPERMEIPAVTLGSEYTGGIPAVNATYALGAALSAISGLEMRLFANVTRVLTTTENLIADSRRGDPDNVVMAGAHLDSVAEGPGINDNGSGSSALLEVAEQMAKIKTPNKVRFAWWGAEEDGTVGSAFYVASLTPEQLAGLEMYLNFDMVGSPNFGLFIYDGDGSGFGLEGPPGSDDIEALFERFYADRGIPTEPTAFDGRSDYFDFINNGVPAGGLFTGAEVPKTAEQVEKWGGQANVAFDPCYHQACDTIDNLSYRALRINADAMAYVTFLFASGKEVITTD